MMAMQSHSANASSTDWENGDLLNRRPGTKFTWGHSPGSAELENTKGVSSLSPALPRGNERLRWVTNKNPLNPESG
jgi:hypothetical protein